MTQKHTPTPWYADINFITDGQRNEVAHITSYHMTLHEECANAAHIVKCVNMHDELVEALSAMVRNGRKQGWDYNYENDMDNSREVLKKAGAL